ncbi:MAG: hypothetical protein ACRYGA_00735 [Janthinobacterium lividum]
MRRSQGEFYAGDFDRLPGEIGGIGGAPFHVSGPQFWILAAYTHPIIDGVRGLAACSGWRSW